MGQRPGNPEQTGSNPVAGRRWFGFSLRQHALALVVFAAITVGFFHPIFQGETISEVGAYQQGSYPWKLVMPGERRLEVPLADHVETFYPWQVFMGRELRQGDVPLWNPYSFGGAPFFANGQNGVLYPPRLALAHTTSPWRVHDVLLASHMFLAGVAMLLLLGFVGLSFPAALVGGIAWMLNTFALTWQALEHYTAIEVWLPVCVLLAHAMVRRRSWPAAFGLVLAAGVLVAGANILFAELALVAALGYAVALAVVAGVRDRAGIGGAAARIATTLVLVAGLTAVFTLPTFRLATEGARVSLDYGELAEYAMPRDVLLNIFKLPKFNHSDPYHVDLFAGTAVGLLAIVGLVSRQALARFATVLGVLVILFMLRTPVTYVVAQVLPGMSSFKPLARAAFLLQFSLAVLAAYGTQTVLGFLVDPRRRRLVWTPLAAGMIVGVVADRVMVHVSSSGRLAGGLGFVLALALVPLTALVVAQAGRDGSWIGRSTTAVRARMAGRVDVAAVVLVGLVAASIVGQEWLWARQVMTHQPTEARLLFPRTPLIERLEQRQGERVLPTDWALHGSTAMVYPLLSAGGYESLLPQRVQDFWRVLGDRVPPRSLERQPMVNGYNPAYRLERLRPALLARAGIASVASPPIDVTGARVPEGLDLRYSGGDGRIFDVAGALPRSYVVGDCVEAATPLAALERFVSPAFSAGDAVVLERESLRKSGMSCAGGRSGPAGAAVVRDDAPDSAQVSFYAVRPGWLVLGDSWDEGWEASIDGRDVEVLPANYALRALRVPAGSHEVRFTYRPASFRVGAAVSAAFLLVAVSGLAISLLVRRRRRGTEPPTPSVSIAGR
jgi:membrane protein YfhO